MVINKEKIKNTLSDFFFRNRFVRSTRIFIHQKLKFLLLKIIAGAIALIVLILFIIKIVNPSYLSHTYHKASFYFQRFINLDNHQYQQVNVKGNNRTQAQDIIKIVRQVQAASTIDLAQEGYHPLIKQITLALKEKLPWVENAAVTRSIPDTLNIMIEEYDPFALWYYENKKYVTDKKGNTILVEDVSEFSDLIIVSGEEANIHVNSLFNIFTINAKLSSEVYSATWSGGRRWDIRLDNGLLIKLPETDISEAWDSLIKIYNLPGSIIGLNVIDLRISDKIYLEYNDKVIKEIKSL